MRLEGSPRRIEIICETSEELAVAQAILDGKAKIYWGRSEHPGGAIIVSTLGRCPDVARSHPPEPSAAVPRKNCTKCGMMKNIAAFCLDRDAPDGHVANCADCEAERMQSSRPSSLPNRPAR